MKIGELDARAFATRLKAGVQFRTGPWITRLRSPYRDLAEAIHYVYADHPLDDGGFADFHVRVEPPPTIRRWIRRQSLFFVDDRRFFEPYPGHLSMPLFEWGLNWCIAGLGHQYLIIHAAVLERDGRAVLMPAKPGAGKSTLCAALAHRGWRLLSDEFALVRRDNGELDPIPRPIGLKNESIDVIRAFAPECKLGPIWPGTSKGTVSHLRPPADAVARIDERARPRWIVFPTYKPGAPAAFDEHGKGDAVLRVADHCLNYTVLGEPGFDLLCDTVDACVCCEFEYGDLDEAMAAFDALAREAT